jgi:Ni/Co efflux regulator RcnB
MPSAGGAARQLPPPPPIASAGAPMPPPPAAMAGQGMRYHGGWANAGGPPMANGAGPRQGPRWGGKINGRWWAGMQAPGGWRSYRRPSRGFVLPGYWLAPGFYISDYAYFGLQPPPLGYHWTRYYDDAVLVDDSGRVWDSAHGLDWDRDDAYAQMTYQGGDYNYGYNYGYQGGYVGAYPPPPPGYAPPPGPIVQPLPGGGYTQTVVAGGSVVGGYWYPPVTTTTITYSTPVVTTTTTEYVETVRYKAARRVYHAPKRRVVKPCTCGCCCRR